MKTTIEQTWPMIEVEYRSPRPRKVITLEEAAEKYGLDEREVGWLRRGEVAGTSVNKSSRGDDVYMLHRYTLKDSIRDAGPALLKALSDIMDCDLVPKDSAAGRAALAAIKEANRD